jgi:hypothetical protein
MVIILRKKRQILDRAVLLSSKNHKANKSWPQRTRPAWGNKVLALLVPIWKRIWSLIENLKE